ncbi:exonuclease domain-containing protein [Pseudobutyrivibrio ruminis]|uniref:Exonuclease n=1 Tax=Pseudobutyrivibrio ruminis DSM 9787 TaxID=1123011 RepID=A0A285S560_9FIRM|nr:exonuclease domain-containing protein [Pseudobutyrivibrio ruminis]SOC01677.1 Exonuclease [Pseudobutyrivibrio ruminis DSM 9787]
MATNNTSTKNKVKGPSQTAPAGYKGKNQAFLDAEYLSARYKKSSIEDVISVGVIITNPAHEELDRFYSTVQLRPGHKLPPLITELTGLTNEDLEDAPAYEDVMTELITRIRKFQVGKICVWGGDKNSFQRDYESRNLEKPLKRSVAKFISTFDNIQKEVSLDVTGGLDANLSLADMKTICGLGGYVEHNALADAEDMLNCIRIIEQDQMKYDGVRAAEYKKFRGEYVKNRSFGDVEEDDELTIDSKLGFEFLEELKAKGFENNPKTKAFMDDLGFLLGQGNVYMGTFSEMMEEKNM